jgi:hypothetical protein
MSLLRLVAGNNQQAAGLRFGYLKRTHEGGCMYFGLQSTATACASRKILEPVQSVIPCQWVLAVIAFDFCVAYEMTLIQCSNQVCSTIAPT